MKMGHVTELLSAYLDEQVGSGERARITTHLEACESCRAHLESLRKTVALLHTTEPARAPEVSVSTPPPPFPGPPAASVDRAARAPEVGAPAPYTPGEPALRRVIRTASVMLEVGDLDQTASRLTRIAEAAGGFIADSSFAQAGSTPEGTFVLRVPAPRFADVLSQVEELGQVQQRRISGQDVTEEYVDLQARIRNLERYEQRLLAFADRAAQV